jgi:NADH-quinone oxidoreductase subunit E
VFSPELRSRAEELVARYPVGRSALLPLLHLVQHVDGHVTADGVAECAELLGLTKAEVSAVATFYTMYKRAPMGAHLVSVCTNFSCKVRGAQDVYDRLAKKLGVHHNETTADGRFTLEHAECLGNCEGAPVVTVDYLNYECLTPEAAEELLERVAAGDPPPPTRGFAPPGIRTVQHRLAGLGPVEPSRPGAAPAQTSAADAGVPVPDAGPGAAPAATPAPAGPDQSATEPELRDDLGEGDMGAEETAPAGLGAHSGSGGGHDYPPGSGTADESEHGETDPAEATPPPDHEASPQDHAGEEHDRG